MKQPLIQASRAEILSKSNVVEIFPGLFVDLFGFFPLKWCMEAPCHSLSSGLWSHMPTIFTPCLMLHAQILAYLENGLPLSCQDSDSATDCEDPLLVVLALNPVKHFLRSLIASLRLIVCLSTLLNYVLLDPCQMKTDELIYPDALLWAFRRAVRSTILSKGVLQSKGGSELSDPRPQHSSEFPGKL